MKNFLVMIIGTILCQSVYATNLNLTCTELNSSRVVQVVTGSVPNDTETIIPRKFAIMIELVEVMTQKGFDDVWTVFKPSEYTLKRIKLDNGDDPIYQFVEVANKKGYDCHLTRRFRTLPGVTRSNN